MASVEEILRRNLLSRSKLARVTQDEDGVTHYSCVECPASYDDKEKMELHLCKHTKEYRYLCGICGAGLKRKEHLERHTQEHMEVRPHICKVCDKAFKRKEHLNIHLSIHKGDKSLQCKVCGKTFYRKDHLQKHVQTHNRQFLGHMLDEVAEQDMITIKQEAEDDEYLNPVITSVSGSLGETEIKMEVEESSQDESEVYNSIKPIPVIEDALYLKMRPHVCTICNKRYKRRDHLKVHSITHLKKKKVCSECGKAFHTEDQLLTHINLVHMKTYSMEGDHEGISRLKIMLGDKVDVRMLSDGTDLLVPRMKQRDDRPHVCRICNRKFKRKQHLKVHGNVHMRLSQPTIWCSLCNEGFYTNSHFEQHQCTPWETNTDGAADDEQVYNVPQEAKKENICSQDYVEVIDDSNPEESDVGHDQLEQEEQLGPLEQLGQFEQLEQLEQLEQFEDMQEPDFPVPRRVYVCKYCTKPFKRKDHFKIHLHIHTGVKSFFCEVCGKGFYRKDHLQKHTLVHNKVKPKPKKAVPDLFPISMLPKEIIPEITIHAPSNTKLRVPLQIKVPYQMVMSMENGEQRAVTIDPQANTKVL
ncbi:unnamed protein product [Parnassius apollo]|uniref:(apollo) hypothetical protein n=1 Tax=Parnassius apollo TaxID=110799 RepID=A0A8S3XRT7_PARAO|nr:unnamed protein product [Parnassius apollo]